MKPNIVLGTANLGLRYGIANNRRLSETEAFTILEKASEAEVNCVDTARNYGDAEKVLGRFFRRHGKLFDVVTKLPEREYRCRDDVKTQVKASLEDLCIERIDTLLVHSFRSFEQFNEVLLPAFEEFVSEGLIGTYGLSVYHPLEAYRAVETASRLGCRIAAVQFPLNLFDQRFLKGGHIQRFRFSGIELYARSIFLQGLFFMDVAALGAHFDQARPKIEQLLRLAATHTLPPEALALLFAISSGVDNIVLGVDSAAQLKADALLMAGATPQLMSRLKHCFDMLQCSNEDIILPYRWKQ